MRVVGSFLVASLLSSCCGGPGSRLEKSGERGAYPHALDLRWRRDPRPPEGFQRVVLADGGEVRCIGDPAGDDRSGRLTCYNESGTVRWSVVPRPSEPVDAGAFWGREKGIGERIDLPVSVWLSGPLAGFFVAVDETQLYLVQYCRIASGCEVVAFDLRTGRQNWARRALGLGVVYHSRYWNQVEAKMIGPALVLHGREAGGRYIEVLSPDGERLSSRVVGSQ